MRFFSQNIKAFSLLVSGLGMYESPLFLATHEEESGGRSVPTTLLQVAAPGTCLSISLIWWDLFHLFTHPPFSSAQFLKIIIQLMWECHQMLQWNQWVYLVFMFSSSSNSLLRGGSVWHHWARLSVCSHGEHIHTRPGCARSSRHRGGERRRLPGARHW